jgi:hypothetical protein
VVADACKRRQRLGRDVDLQQLVFEVNALLLMGHTTYTMFRDPSLLERSRRGLERLLGPRPNYTAQ